MPATPDATDDGRLLRAAARDPEAFGRLYDRHVAAVIAYLVRRTACPETAADLAAETFAEAFRSRRRFDPARGPVRAWLFGIARHKLLTWARDERRATVARRRLGLERPQLDDEQLRRIEALADLAPIVEALDRLPAPTAEAVRLRVIGELPFADVARALGCSEGAARVRVCRGLSRLNDLMEGFA